MAMRWPFRLKPGQLNKPSSKGAFEDVTSGIDITNVKSGLMQVLNTVTHAFTRSEADRGVGPYEGVCLYTEYLTVTEDHSIHFNKHRINQENVRGKKYWKVYARVFTADAGLHLPDFLGKFSMDHFGGRFYSVPPNQTEDLLDIHDHPYFIIEEDNNTVDNGTSDDGPPRAGDTIRVEYSDATKKNGIVVGIVKRGLGFANVDVSDPAPSAMPPDARTEVNTSPQTQTLEEAGSVPCTTARPIGFSEIPPDPREPNSGKIDRRKNFYMGAGDNRWKQADKWDSLNATFRTKLESMFRILEADNWEPVIWYGYRPEEVQRHAFVTGNTPIQPPTWSYHNVIVNGSAAARGADIVDKRYGYTHYKFNSKSYVVADNGYRGYGVRPVQAATGATDEEHAEQIATYDAKEASYNAEREKFWTALWAAAAEVGLHTIGAQDKAHVEYRESGVTLENLRDAEIARCE